MSLAEREKRIRLAEKLQSWVYEAAEEARRLVKFTNDPEDENIENLLLRPLESAAMSFDELIARLRDEANDNPTPKKRARRK